MLTVSCYPVILILIVIRPLSLCPHPAALLSETFSSLNLEARSYCASSPHIRRPRQGRGDQFKVQVQVLCHRCYQEFEDIM